MFSFTKRAYLSIRDDEKIRDTPPVKRVIQITNQNEGNSNLGPLSLKRVLLERLEDEVVLMVGSFQFLGVVLTAGERRRKRGAFERAFITFATLQKGGDK
eukprot:TRINITY_DN2091_c1_g1_i1.p1 TRINITY_DN2091_c1_g1~~TRINITY_DN2091_c1_g1_i1.p1  ORF type:complete len:100 (-),score=12.49 TRINITY_DN2091_c1_g1_i1:1280-1579(-)